jgi:hypothetical protein
MKSILQILLILSKIAFPFCDLAQLDDALRLWLGVGIA